MGQRIEKKRKISADRVRKLRKQKNNILIAVEGKNKTEKLYFNNFDDGKQPYSIIFARGNFTDPLNLVKMLIKEINILGLNLKEGDIAYCIFDTDVDPSKNDIINEAKKLANSNNIKVITSTPSIELWFLLHYKYTTASMNNKNVIENLKKYYPDYEKNINIYPDIKDKTRVVIKRAKELESFQLSNGKVIGNVETNPNTEIYKIVEELLQN